MSQKSKSILYKLTLGFVPLALVWAIDWFTKMWAVNLEGFRNFGFLHLELVYNHGVVLGFYSQLPLFVKTVTLTTLGAGVLCSYTLVISLVPIKSLWLRLGLPILVGGIIGNVTDRFVYNAVVDFIAIKFNHYNSPVMNVADLFQWVGYACILFGLYEDSRYYWPTLDLRNKFFINARFQIRTGLMMGLFSIVSGFIMLVFGFSFVQESLAKDIARFYLIYGSALIVFLSVAISAIGVVLSHRVAGPVYALIRYLNDSRQGKTLTFKLREHDEFKELEDPLTILNSELHRLYEIEKKYKTENTPPPLPDEEALKKIA